MESNTIWIASFDIGKKNFAFCIEEVDTHAFNSVDCIPKKERYSQNGTPTQEFATCIKKVGDNGRIVCLKLKDLTDGIPTKKQLDTRVLINLTKFLDTYRSFWDRCSIFVIEQQMGFGKKQNTVALKIGQHCFSYFLFQYANFKKIIEFPAYHKTKVLGAPKKLKKYDRKAWSVDEALRILVDRGDTEQLENIRSKRKKDDCADVITQLQAFKWLYFIDQQEFD